MAKLFPTDPTSCMVIRQLSPNITTFSLPFSRFGQARIGARSTLIKLPSGSLAVFSPVPLTEDVRNAVKSMGGGRVKYITAPDIEHHIQIGAWHKEFPDAKVIAPEGLPEKRAKMQSEEVRFDVLAKAGSEHGHSTGSKFGVDEEFDNEFDTCYVPGHGNKELVFNYKREKTLIEADLMFNLPCVEQYSKSKESPHTGILTRLMTSLNGTTGSSVKWQQRFIWYAVSSGDREGFGKSIRTIEGWDFDRIIPCHGDVIENGGKDVFRSVMQWHLKPKQ